MKEQQNVEKKVVIVSFRDEIKIFGA